MDGEVGGDVITPFGVPGLMAEAGCSVCVPTGTHTLTHMKTTGLKS